MKTKLTASLVTLATLATFSITGLAYAYGGGEGVGRGQGLSLERVPEMAERAFDQLDTDANGSLSSEELAAAIPTERVETDINGDGAISRDEALAAAEARFEAGDTNSDGLITEDERAQSAWRGGRGNRSGRKLPAAFELDTLSAPIDRTAFVAHLVNKAAGLDVDNDGVLTREEMHATGQER